MTAKRSRSSTDKLTKTDLTDLVAARTGIRRSHTKLVIDELLELIILSLQDGTTVGLQGLGTLKVIRTTARLGVWPGTSNRLAIPAKRKITFKPALTLRQNVGQKQKPSP